MATRSEIKANPVLYRQKVEQLLAVSALILEMLEPMSPQEKRAVARFKWAIARLEKKKK